jgi:hypothetical protein
VPPPSALVFPPPAAAVAAPVAAARPAPAPAAAAPVVSAPAAQAAAPTRASRDILISSAAAMLLLSALLSLPSDLLDRFRGADASVAVAAALPEAAPATGPFELGRTVHLAYTADPRDPARVAAVLADSPDWMKPGQRIVEVNGQPVQSGADIPDLLTGTADLSSAKVLNVILGYQPTPGADVVRKVESLPVVGELRLPDGLSFAIVPTSTGPQTIVASVPAGSDTGLLPGDVVLEYRPTGEAIDTDTALADILAREAANGVATYSITVQRKSNRLEAMFRLSGDA